MTLRQRSYQKELLDGTQIPFADIKQNMHELDTINHWLGGHRITLKGLQSLLPVQPAATPLHILEIGCGGGDNLRVVKSWATRKSRAVQLTGVDINPECIQFAQERTENKGIHFICSDYRHLLLNEKPDVVFSSLFCHHFTDEELNHLLQWKWQNSSLGFFINDLHRHVLAYYSIKWLTRFLSNSYLVKNDAPLSVQRGFKKEEWMRLLRQAGILQYTLQWQWAFRWLLVVKKNYGEH